MQCLHVGCVVSRITWHDVPSWCRLTIQPPDGSLNFYDWWTLAMQDSLASHDKGLVSLIALTNWTISRHRTACTFNGATPPHTHLVRNIREEARTLAKAAARGLSTIILVT